MPIDPAAVTAANFLGYQIPGVNAPKTKREPLAVPPSLPGITTNAAPMTATGLAPRSYVPTAGPTEEPDALAAAQQRYNDARDERDATIQDMFEKRKQAMAMQRATHTGIAKSTALGNVLRSLVQPLGWAAGGSVAPVVPYDSRQYIDAFNRAVQYDNNIVNAGAQEGEYQIRRADEEVRNAQRDYEHQKLRAESKEDAAELAASRGGLSNSTLAGLYKEYGAYRRRYFADKRAGKVKDDEQLLSFEELFGVPDVWGAADSTGAAASTEAAQEQSAEEVAAPAAVPPKKVAGLTPEQERIIKTWEKYDKNKDGKLSADEMKRGLRFWKPKADDNTAKKYEEAMAKKRAAEKKNAKQAMKVE